MTVLWRGAHGPGPAAIAVTSLDHAGGTDGPAGDAARMRPRTERTAAGAAAAGAEGAGRAAGRGRRRAGLLAGAGRGGRPRRGRRPLQAAACPAAAGQPALRRGARPALPGRPRPGRAAGAAGPAAGRDDHRSHRAAPRHRHLGARRRLARPRPAAVLADLAGRRPRPGLGGGDPGHAGRGGRPAAARGRAGPHGRPGPERRPDGTVGPIGDLAPEPGTAMCVAGGRAYAPRTKPAAHWVSDWDAAPTLNAVAVWRRGDKDPWLLLTDLPARPRRCADYRRRTWEEELFRDLEGLGWGWDKSRVRAPERVTRLVAVLALATLWVAAVGQRVLRDGRRPLLEDRGRRCCSRIQLGLRWAKRLAATGDHLPCVLRLRVESPLKLS